MAVTVMDRESMWLKNAILRKQLHSTHLILTATLKIKAAQRIELFVAEAECTN